MLREEQFQQSVSFLRDDHKTHKLSPIFYSTRTSHENRHPNLQRILFFRITTSAAIFLSRHRSSQKITSENNAKLTDAKSRHLPR